MPITLTNPIRVGGLADGITIDQLEIAAISYNAQSGHVQDGKAVLSIVLEHPASGWSMPVTWRDASVLQFAGGIKATFSALLAAIWQKLQDDGKLPAGTVDVQIPQETAIDAAVTAAQALKTIAATPLPAISPVVSPPTE